MYSRMVCSALALLAGLALAIVGLTPRLVAPPAALALDQTVTTCDFATFEATLAAVQADGGGTIAFDCSGEIEFAGEQEITTDVTIIGNGTVTFDGNESTRFFTVNTDARLALAGLTLTDGEAVGDGGAIRNSGTLEVTASTFSSNRAIGGSGGVIDNAATAEITASTFAGNQADSFGGAIDNSNTLKIIASIFTSNQAGNFGGAIYNADTVEIATSTFTGNQAQLGGAIRNGGTLRVSASTFNDNQADAAGAIANIGPLEIITSTFTGNQASDGDGGAIDTSGMTEITASTFTGNQASDGGAIHLSFAGGSVEISSSILANSTGAGNCSGTFTSLGSNLSDDASCGFGAGDNGTPNLADLADNGGPTHTSLPESPSDALDAAGCTHTTMTDQRGAARPATGCDIGSVEVGASVPVQIVAFFSTSGTINEGDPATLHVIAYGPDNDSLSYLFDCNNDGTYSTPGTGASTSATAECTLLDDGSSTVGVQVCDGANGTPCATETTKVAVLNVAPTIETITTNAPLPQGQPVTVTVTASDAGVNDTLTYSFDCDDDGSYETAGAGNQGQCALDPAAATSTIGVQVSDDDGGAATGSVEVSQTLTFCGNYFTGSLSMPSASGCPNGSTPLVLPAATSTTLCLNPYSGAVTWSPAGSCGPNVWPHLVPDDGPLTYCRHQWTGQLRHTWNGQCGPYETAGVIPG